MPIKGLILLLLTTCIFSQSVFAMSPQIRLPQWHNTSISLSEYKPDQGLLTVQVEIVADFVSLSNISSRLHGPESLKLTADVREKAILKKGDRAVFLHQIKLAADYHGWLEVDVRAQPHQGELMQLVKATSKDSPIALKVLEAEVRSVNQPISIGRSMPLFTSNDIAMSTTAEMALRPELKVGNHQLYLWYPPTGIGSGLTAEALKAFDTAIRQGNFSRAEAAARLVKKRFSDDKEALLLEKAKGETFTIPGKMVIELIDANLVTLKALNEKDPMVLLKAAQAAGASYLRPFLHFNLATVYELNKQPSEAKEHFLAARKDLPTWPMLDKRIKSLK